ncbi:MAG: bifunctional pyr operon transcriptional regulator/uracil phosphoribosyltransferase PyrR [Limisphaerales bacterium]
MSDPHTVREVLFDDEAVGELVGRLAESIDVADRSGDGVVLLGIQTGGIHLANRLAAELSRRWAKRVPVGRLDINMHRDDLARQFAPPVHPTEIPCDLAGKTVVLVDDVLFSGRTARAALEALNDLGRPDKVQLAVLVDRGHRQLPIQADFVGRQIATGAGDRVNVVVDADGLAKVILEKADGQ